MVLHIGFKYDGIDGIPVIIPRYVRDHMRSGCSTFCKKHTVMPVPVADLKKGGKRQNDTRRTVNECTLYFNVATGIIEFEH